MNLLIVDDQSNVLTWLATSISWSDIGISHVYSASSVLTAKEIIRSHDIQILLTDIEMPVQSGLDLIKWIREKELPIESILLTSHTDFMYAKQAIPLGVLDYVIQPAGETEIKETVQKAVRLIKEKKKMQHQHSLNHFSRKETNQLIAHFMQNWPRQKTGFSSGADELADYLGQLADLGIHCEKEDSCLLFILQVQEWHTIPDAPLQLLAQYEEIAGEVFSYIQGDFLSFITEDSSLVTMLVSPAQEDIEEYLRILNENVQSAFSCVSVIFYSQATMQSFAETCEYLMHNEALQEKQNGASIHRVVPITKENAVSIHYQNYYDQICAYIRENITSQISRRDISKHIHISSDYISHIVRSVGNCSCNELIRNMKMDYAQKLVRTTSMSIGNIAAKCGYDSFAYFTRVYKSIYGVSPSRDRLQHYHG